MRRFRQTLALPVWLAFGAAAVAGDTEEANRIFVGAVKAWQEAETITIMTPEDARAKAEVLERVHNSLNLIVDRYSGSDLAVQLVLGQSLGPVSLDGVGEALRAARAEMSGADCFVQPTPQCVASLAVEALSHVDDEWREDTAADMILDLARAGQVDLALDLLPSVVLERVDFLEKLEIARLTRSADLLTLLAKEANKSGRAMWRESELGLVVAAMSEIGQHEEAAELRVTLVDHDHEHQGMAEAALRKGEIADALKRVDLIRHEAVRAGVQGQAATWLAENDSREAALSLIAEMDDVEERELARIKVGEALGDPDLVKAAIGWSDSQKERARDVVRGSGVEALAHLGQANEGLAVIANESSYFIDTSRLAVVRILAFSGDMEAASKLAGEIESTRDGRWAQAALASATARDGDITGALRILDRADAEIGHDVARCVMGMILAEAGEPKAALSVVRGVEQGHYCYPSTLTKIATSLQSATD